MEAKRRKHNLRIFILIIVLLPALGAASYLQAHWKRLDDTRQTAQALEATRDYLSAMEAYAQLLEDSPLTPFPAINPFPAAGAEGILSCADALLTTPADARKLWRSGLFDEIGEKAPALQPNLKSRSLLCRALMAQEEGELEEALSLARESGLRPELVKALTGSLEDLKKLAAQQALLAQALAAREAGQLEEAIDLLRQSELEPELIPEIEQQIADEQDQQLSDQARKALDALDYSAAIALAAQLSTAQRQEALEKELTEGWCQKFPKLREKYAHSLHAGAWYSLVQGPKPLLTGDRRYEGLKDRFSSEDRIIDGLFSLMKISEGRVALLGDTLGADEAVEQITDAKDGALGLNHGLILHGDGTVTNLGARQYGRGQAELWTNITQVAAGGFHSLGLTDQGTLVAAGLDLDGQCQVQDWTNVIAVDAGLRHTVALLSDGHVMATGDNSFGQCDVAGWEHIIDIRCGGNFTLGLTADYRLLAVGDNSCGQCDVAGWPKVLAMDAGLWHTVALLSDGRVVTAGASGHDQCGVGGALLFAGGDQADIPASVHLPEKEAVYYGQPSEGPWLYYSGDGCVIAAFDTDSGRIKATRADLICTYGHPPAGILSGGGDKPVGTIHARVLAEQNRAVFAITGDYFTFAYNADGLQLRRGVVFKQEKDEVGFGFYPDGSMRIIDPKKVTAEELLAMGVKDSWVFGPTLILDGKALDIHKHPLSYNDVTMRTVFASLCPYHHLAATYSSSTLAQVPENLLGYGVDIAYNLDGGRSSMMVFMGQTINRSMYMHDGWRGLQDMVGFLTSDLVPTP